MTMICCEKVLLVIYLTWAVFQSYVLGNPCSVIEAEYFDGKCFKIFWEEVSHDEAQGNCTETWIKCGGSGRLAEPRTDQQVLFLQRMAKRNIPPLSTTGIYLGGGRATPGANVTWSDGEIVNTSCWHPGNPDNYQNDEDCLEITTVYGTFLLNDEACYWSKFYACEFYIGDLCESTMPDSEYYEGQCFKIYNNPEYWSDANAICAEHGGFLAEPRTDDMYDFLFMFIDFTVGNSVDMDYLIGLNDETTEGDFRWPSDNAPLELQRWSPGDPSKKKTENQAVISSELGYMINVDAVQASYPFICQAPTLTNTITEITILTNTCTETTTLPNIKTETNALTNTQIPTSTFPITQTETSTLRNTQTVEIKTLTNAQTEINTLLSAQTETNTLPNTPKDTNTITSILAETNTLLNTPTERNTLTSIQVETRTLPNTQTDTNTLTSTQTEIRTLQNTQTEISTLSNTQTETSTFPNTHTETFNSTSIQTETSTLPNTQTEISTLPNTQTETGTLPNTQTETSTLPNTQTETSTLPNTQTETSTLPNTQTETSTLPNIQTDTITLTSIQTETKAIPNIQTETITLTSIQAETSRSRNTQTDTNTLPNTQTETTTLSSIQSETSTIPNIQTETYTLTSTQAETSASPNTQTETNTLPNTRAETINLTSIQIETYTFMSIQTETGTLPNTQTETSTLPNTQTETSTLPNTQTETSTLPNTQTETSTLPNTQTETSTLPNTQTETSTLPNTQTETSTLPNTQTETSTLPNTQTETSTLPNTQTETSTLPNIQTDTITLTSIQTETKAIPNIQTETITLTSIQTETSPFLKTQTETNTLPNTPTETNTLRNTQTETNTFRTIPIETNTNTYTFINTYLAVIPICFNIYNTTVTMFITNSSFEATLVRITLGDDLGQIKLVTENEIGNMLTDGINVPVTELAYINSSGISSAYVEVKSTLPITVLMYYETLSLSGQPIDIASTLILPISMLTHNYFLLSHSTVTMKKLLTVTALEYNTQVTIKMSSVVSQDIILKVGHFKFINSGLATFILNKYETALIEASEIAGSFIYGTKPIAVFTCTQINIDGATSSSNSGLDMVIPADHMDTKYVTFPSWPHNASPLAVEKIQILAMHDNTIVQIYDGNNQTITLSKAGDFREVSIPMSKFCFMESNIPFQVMKLSSDVAVGCTAQLVPSSLWRNEYSIMSPPLPHGMQAAVHFLIAEEINSFHFEATQCDPIQGTNLYGCIMKVVPMSTQHIVYTKSSATPFIVYQAWIDNNGKTRSCFPWGVNEYDFKDIGKFEGEAYLNQTRQSCVFPTNVMDGMTVTTTATIHDIEITSNSDILQTTVNIPNEVEKFKNFIDNELHIEIKDTSAFKRTKISIPDSRPSSTAIGLFGAALMVAVFGLILSADITRVMGCLIQKL